MSGSTACTTLSRRDASASAVIADDLWSPRPPGSPGETGQRRCFIDGERARGPVDDVEPDRLGTSRDGREHAGHVRHATDLHGDTPRNVGGIRRGRARSHERPNRGCRVRRPHERFADERAIEAEGPPAGDDRRIPDAGFSDHEPIVGDELAQAAGAFDIDLERPQVAVVEPDQSSVRRERRIELTCVVDLHERLKAELERRSTRRRESLRRMEDGQQEHKRPRRPLGASGSWTSSTTNSLARTGTATAARTARRSSIEPPNQCGSHRTEIAAAPPASYARARATMSSSPAAISPGRRRCALDLGDEVEARRDEAFGDRTGAASPTSLGERRGTDALDAAGCRRGVGRRSRSTTFGGRRGPSPAAAARPAVVPAPGAGRSSRRRAGAPLRDRRVRQQPRPPLRPQRSSRSAASPASMVSAARSMPSSIVVDGPGDKQRRPCVEQHDIAPAPGSPRRTASMIRAFSSGVPPDSRAVAARSKPERGGIDGVSLDGVAGDDVQHTACRRAAARRRRRRGPRTSARCRARRTTSAMRAAPRRPPTPSSWRRASRPGW